MLNYTNITTPQTNSNETDGIEILVSMAKSGKLNPWNIDIVDITDKFLTNMFEMKAQNLKLTGRTFLFASILLKLKSNVLEGLDILELPEAEADNEFDDDGALEEFQTSSYVSTPIKSIDEVLERRTSVKLNRKRVVTLKELIKHLEFYEKLEKKQSLKNAHERAKRRVQSYANFSAEDIINLAHEEFIEKTVNTIKSNLENIFKGKKKIELSELVSIGINKVEAYISLLFLVAGGEYELVQDEFYSDLYVVRENGAVEV